MGRSYRDSSLKQKSVCEGIVTSLHIHSTFHLQFNERKLRANNTPALRGKVWWFWGNLTSLFHAMDTCSFVLWRRAAGWTRFLLRSQIPSLSPEPRTSAHSCTGVLLPSTRLWNAGTPGRLSTESHGSCSLRRAAGAAGCAQDATKTHWNCQTSTLPQICY